MPYGDHFSRILILVWNNLQQIRGFLANPQKFVSVKFIFLLAKINARKIFLEVFFSTCFFIGNALLQMSLSVA